MDGQQVASAQSANGGRAFEFDQASLGNIETIEVTKAPTAFFSSSLSAAWGRELLFG